MEGTKASRRRLPPPRTWARCAAEFQPGMRKLRIECTDDLSDDTRAMLAAGRRRDPLTHMNALSELSRSLGEDDVMHVHAIGNRSAASTSNCFNIDYREADVIDAIELSAPDDVRWQLFAGNVALAHGVGSARIEATIYFICMAFSRLSFEFDRELARDQIVVRLKTLWLTGAARTELARTDVRQTFGDLELRYAGGVLRNA